MYTHTYTQLKANCDFDARKAAVDKFNDTNKFVKRGISITPVKFGMSFTAKFMNQVRAHMNMRAKYCVYIHTWRL